MCSAASSVWLALIAYVGYARRSVISNQLSVISGSVIRRARSAQWATAYGTPITDGLDHRLLFYLLSLFFFAPRLMRQADAGDVAVGDVVAGLLAVASFESRDSNSQRSTLLRLVREENPSLSLVH